jgi:hypothetical protein
MQEPQIWKTRGNRKWSSSSCPTIRKSPSRKSPTKQQKWGGSPSNCKTVPTGTWRKVAFSIMARKMSPVTLAPSFSRLGYSGFLLLGVCFLKDIVYRGNLQNSNELRDRIVRAAECVTNEMLVSTCTDTEYRLYVCVVLLVVPILRCTEHIRNFVRSSVWKCVDFSNTLWGWRL